MNIYEKLGAIQTELKAPKGNYNTFGKYKYRSCEDILESVKPILAKNKTTMIITDDVVQVGDRFYIKAEAVLMDMESNETIKNTAFAREENEKKGMDGSQITGTASSYARKYCLNGLLLIDDTKDADTDAYKLQQTKDLPKAETTPSDVPSEEEQAFIKVMEIGKNNTNSINRFIKEKMKWNKEVTDLNTAELLTLADKLTTFMEGKK